jgi:hypothetical protein
VHPANGQGLFSTRLPTDRFSRHSKNSTALFLCGYFTAKDCNHGMAKPATPVAGCKCMFSTAMASVVGQRFVCLFYIFVYRNNIACPCFDYEYKELTDDDNPSSYHIIEISIRHSHIC